jgi:hypothetical protein
VFDPAFTVQLGALDGSTKIHFAVKGTRATSAFVVFMC